MVLKAIEIKSLVAIQTVLDPSATTVSGAQVV